MLGICLAVVLTFVPLAGDVRVSDVSQDVVFVDVKELPLFASVNTNYTYPSGSVLTMYSPVLFNEYDNAIMGEPLRGMAFFAIFTASALCLS